MGDAWARDILRCNLAATGLDRSEMRVMVFVNGPVDQVWHEITDRVLSDGTNHGFPVAANELLHASSNEEILLIDDDIVQPSSWLVELQKVRSTLIKYGIPVGIGAVPLDVWKDETDGLGPLTDTFGAKYRPRSVPIGGTRHFFRKHLVDFGYICEGYFPCGGDDVDFCIRAYWGGRFNYHIEAVRSHHDHHDRGGAYVQAKQEGLARIAAVDIQQRNLYQQKKFKYEPPRPWLFS
jgi:hypothetical protein